MIVSLDAKEEALEPMVDTLVELYRQVHGELRAEIERLDDDALHWQPGPDTNSIAVLAVHLLGSEGEVLTIVRGQASERQREEEFVDGRLSRDELLARIADADRVLVDCSATITATDLESPRPRPNRRPHTGRYWLTRNYGHAREHLAHVQLTRQLYEQRRF